MSIPKEADQVLRDAMQADVFDPQLEAIQHWENSDASLLRPLMAACTEQWEQNNINSPWLGQQASWQLPTTRRYSQSRQAPSTPLVQPDAALDWLVELARFPVPYGSIGILKSFEQYLAQGETTWTETGHWGNPYPSSVSVRWFLRLSPLSKTAAPWVNASGLSAIPDYLPGVAYDDFPESRGLWFPASSSASSNIHLPVPGDRVLRVVAIVEASQEAVQIAVKLAGTVQSETNQDAQTVVRQTW